MTYDHHRFLSNWKTDNKEWMNNRKKSWKYIQIQLDRLRNGYLLNRIKKKDYKYFKNYYLTGKDTIKTPTNIAYRCLGLHGLDHNNELFIQFWLSADHSIECLEYLKKNFFESYNDDYFEEACIFYRESTGCYPAFGKYGWNEREGTTQKNGSIFADLEPSMLSFFSYTSEKKVSLDTHINNDYGSTAQSNFEGVFVGYFGGIVEEPEVDCGFNPNNPIKNMIDEYMRWGFPKHRGHDDCLGFKVAISLIWHVVQTPKGRHPLQLELATDLKQRILNEIDSLSEETQNRFEMAMNYYQSGDFFEYIA